MHLIIQGHDFHYEAENLCRAFLPYEKIKVTDDTPVNDGDSNICIARIEHGDEQDKAISELDLFGKHYSAFRIIQYKAEQSEQQKKELRERMLAHAMYQTLCEALGFEPKWGILTGVRPVKLMRRLIESEGSEQAAGEYFEKNLLVSQEKIKLAQDTAVLEGNILRLSRPDSFSLYISIPFCPTRCSYCSFVSQSVEKSAKLIPEYVQYLLKEIELTGEIARNLGLHLETVYFGGGTPTTLNAQQLTDVMNMIERNFDLSTVREYTIEAGRPDTVTMDKLEQMKSHGVTRISINPQTMSDSVLEAIGRRHTSQQTIEAFEMARRAGFDNINMDLIAGLPEDNAEQFEQTLEKVLSLDPENVTLHTLSMKRSSNMTQSGEQPGRVEAEKMVAMAPKMLYPAGYRPYYLYRQSRILGNLENTGFAKPGYEGLYNVYIMDETHTILSCGASGVTKLRQPNVNRIERIFNFKFPYEYISRFDEICSRKDKIAEFYNSFSI